MKRLHQHPPTEADAPPASTLTRTLWQRLQRRKWLLITLLVCCGYVLGAQPRQAAALVRKYQPFLWDKQTAGRLYNFFTAGTGVPPQNPGSGTDRPRRKRYEVKQLPDSELQRRLAANARMLAPTAGGDTQATATCISALPYMDSGTTVGATDDYDLPSDTTNPTMTGSCATSFAGAGAAGALPHGAVYTGTGTAPDVVYAMSFPSGNTDTLTITMDPTGAQDLSLVVYCNAVSSNPADAIVIDDTGVGGVAESVTIGNIAAGTTLYIVVDGYSTGGTPPGPSGPYTLTVTSTGTTQPSCGGPVNTAPTFTPAAAVMPQQGSPASTGVTLGTVSDAETAAGTLTVMEVAGGTATGITVSNIINTNGTITADISASCSAVSGTVRFEVSDGSLMGTGDLQVNVAANSPPTLTYTNPAALATGGSTMVSPATGPMDNGGPPTVGVATVSPMTFTGTVSANPAGVVTINNAGPPGTYTVTVPVTDNCLQTTNAQFMFTVNQASTTTTITAHTPDPSTLNGLVTVNYAVAVTAPGMGTPTGNVTVSDGVDSCTATVAAGSCQLALSTVGMRTLTATYAGDTSFSGSTSAGVSHMVECPTITLPGLPGGTASLAYNQSVAASPAGTYTYSVSAGALPNGLQLDLNTGAVTGTPSLAGSFSFTITATLTSSPTCTGSQSYTVVIACPTISLSPAVLPHATVNVAYPQTLTASPAGGNYSFAVTSGLLPTGLTLNGDGSFSGAPTQSGTFNFRVTATGFGNCSAFWDYVLLVNCPPITLDQPTLPGGTVGTAYNQSLSASPAGTYSYSVSSGALPSGLTLNSASGAISGTPTVTGTFIFTVSATQSGCTGSHTYTVTIGCQAVSFTTTSLPNAEAGVSYNQMLGVSPAGSYSFSLVTGSLPPGLTLNAATGQLSGTATATGSYSFTVQAQGRDGCGATQTFTLAVTCPVIMVTPASLPNGTTGTAYSQNLSATPSGNYSFAKTSGTLPPGLSLSANGTLSGTPTTQGSYTFTVTTTGFGTCTAANQYTVTITGMCNVITLPALPATGKVGMNYFGNLAATTPSGSYTFSLDSGTLPPGLAIDNLFGALTGKPTAAGSYTFTLKATRNNGCTGTREYTVTITSNAMMGAALARTADYDGDGQSDLTLWTASNGHWQIERSSDAQTTQTAWGGAGDVTLQGDYDGDGQSDLAVFRPANGTWYVKRSSDGSALVKAWGGATDVPVPGDYDGDGQTDVAVFRPSEGNWYVLKSSDGNYEIATWGLGRAPYLDVPVPGDYDGDGKTDRAVFRRSTGMWLIQRSSDGQATVKAWGSAADVPVVGDYDGDGQADVAVWRGATGQWLVLRSSDGGYDVTAWGAASVGDVPVPDDYDGDGKTDLAVWRAPESTWYVRQSSDAAVRTQGPNSASERWQPARR